MTIEDAEKLTIPKYIAERIRKADLKEHTTPDKHLRFYAYLALWKRKELIKITVAAKHYRKKLYMKIVAIHAVHANKCFLKDLEYNYMGAMLSCGLVRRRLAKIRQMVRTRLVMG